MSKAATKQAPTPPPAKLVELRAWANRGEGSVTVTLSLPPPAGAGAAERRRRLAREQLLHLVLYGKGPVRLCREISTRLGVPLGERRQAARRPGSRRLREAGGGPLVGAGAGQPGGAPVAVGRAGGEAWQGGTGSGRAPPGRKGRDNTWVSPPG
jgi:hypothetical protein